MASSSTQQLLKLIIKSANQKYDDFVVDNFDLNWTIKRLKQYLNDNYPRNPETDSIRLIYSGKLLHDHLTLNEVLRHNSEVKSHIIHLVHSNNNSSKPNNLNATNRLNASTLNDDNEIDLDNELTPNSSSLSSSSSSSSTSSSNASPIPSLDTSTNIASNGSNHFTTLNQNDLNNIFQFPMQLQQDEAALNLTPKQKYTRIHENYVRYYESVGVPVHTNSWYSSYVQHMALYNYMYSNYLQSLTMNQTTTNEQLFHTVNTNERGAQDQQEPAQDPVQQQPVPEAAQPPQPAAPAAAAAAQQNRPAAGEAAAERDDDWLSLLHNVVSFLVLFSIIYYYSSIERFLVIFTIVLILILYHNGWLSLQRRHVRPANNNNNNNNNNRRREGDQPDAGNENQSNETEQQINQTANPSIFRLIVTFVLTFFTSLIPERPRPAAAN